MTHDEQHLDLLAIFHYIAAGMMILFSCCLLTDVAMGIAMLCGAFDGNDPPPKFLGCFFIACSCAFMVAGWTLAGFIAAAGRKLKQRRSWTFCVVVAGFECMMVPLGTVLGVFTIIVLMRDSVEQLFSQRPGER